MYFRDEIDYSRFAKFPRSIVKDGIWRKLPKSAQAVFPVYLMHMNDKGVSFPDEGTVSALSGTTCKTAREGRNALGMLPSVTMQRYVTARGRRSWRLTLPVPEGRGTWKRFSGSILWGGNWAKAKPTAKALYPVMLNFAYFGCDNEDTYGDHAYEFCEAEIPVLASLSGLSRNGVLSGLESLTDCDLISPEADLWRVFLTPPKRYKAEHMNKSLKA